MKHKYLLDVNLYKRLYVDTTQEIEDLENKIKVLKENNKNYKSLSEAYCYKCMYRQRRFYTGGYNDVASGECLLVNEDGKPDIEKLELLTNAGILVKHAERKEPEYFPIKMERFNPACCYYKPYEQHLSWADR